jgi:hypothetical protein
MKIIALRGPENSGKTQTLNIVYQLLLRQGFVQLPGNFRILGNHDHQDFTDILTLNDRLLGIVTLGDWPDNKENTESLTKLLLELVIAKCEIIICACRNTPDIESAILEHPDHTFIEKTEGKFPADYRIINGRDALRIIDLL